MPPPAAVKGRLAHQAVHARLGAQPTKGILSFKLNRRAFEARHFTCGCFDQSRFKSLVLAPSQVHAKQHLGPVLRLGATGSGLDIEVSVVGVGFTPRTCDGIRASQASLSSSSQILLYRLRAVSSSSSSTARSSKSLASSEPASNVFDSRIDNGNSREARLTTQCLRFLGIIPDTGLGQF